MLRSAGLQFQGNLPKNVAPCLKESEFYPLLPSFSGKAVRKAESALSAELIAERRAEAKREQED